MFDKFIHKTLKRPYKLTITNDSGKGQPVVFLHGIASSSLTWRNVLPLLDKSPYRLITLDLLGFGESPKPDWNQYDIDAHASAVVATIKALRLKQITLVGHSMGSLIAARVAAQHPELVRHLILCSMPLYANDDLDASVEAYKSTGRHMTNAYFSVYQAIVERPDLTLKSAQQIVKLAGNDTSFRLDKQTWEPFKRSLKNTIENQQSIKDVAILTMPTDIMYGQFDLFVISGYFKQLAEQNPNICVTRLLGRHEISPSYAKKVAECIKKK